MITFLVTLYTLYFLTLTNSGATVLRCLSRYTTLPMIQLLLPGVTIEKIHRLYAQERFFLGLTHWRLMHQPFSNDQFINYMAWYFRRLFDGIFGYVPHEDEDHIFDPSRMKAVPLSSWPGYGERDDFICGLTGFKGRPLNVVIDSDGRLSVVEYHLDKWLILNFTRHPDGNWIDLVCPPTSFDLMMFQSLDKGFTLLPGRWGRHILVPQHGLSSTWYYNIPDGPLRRYLPYPPDTDSSDDSEGEDESVDDNEKEADSDASTDIVVIN